MYVLFLTHAEYAPLRMALAKGESLMPPYNLSPDEVRSVLIQDAHLTTSEASLFMTVARDCVVTLRVVSRPRAEGQRLVAGELCKTSDMIVPRTPHSNADLSNHRINCGCGWVGFGNDLAHVKGERGARLATIESASDFLMREPFVFTQAIMLTNGWTEGACRLQVARHAKDADQWTCRWSKDHMRLTFYPPEYVMEPL